MHDNYASPFRNLRNNPGRNAARARIRMKPALSALVRGMVLAGMSLLGSGCTSVAAPEPEVRLSAADVAMARSAYEELLDKFPAYEHPALQRYVQTVGARLAAVAPRTNFPLRFTVLDSPGLFAYSFAHGEVVIARGLVVHLNSEAQLAAILAHEIGHVVSRHPSRQMQEYLKMRALEEKLSTRLATPEGRDVLSAFTLAHRRAYSREFEIEADTWSERLLARAGYDPSAMAQVLRLFMQENAFWDKEGFELWEMPEADGGDGVFATHPQPKERLQLALQRQGQPTGAAAVPEPAFLLKLDEVVYGLSERYGSRRGDAYLNPSWRLGLTLPPDWYVFGTNDRVVAAPRGRDGLLVMWMKRVPTDETRRRTLELLARDGALGSFASRAGPGVSGETALARMPNAQESRFLRVAAYDVGDQRLHAVGLTFATSHWDETDRQFRALLDSLRPLSPAELRSVQPRRVRAIPYDAAGTNTPPIKTSHERSHRSWMLLNQLYPDGRPAPGQWIKIIE